MLSLRLDPTLPPIKAGRISVQIFAMTLISLRAAVDRSSLIGRVSTLLWIDTFCASPGAAPTAARPRKTYATRSHSVHLAPAARSACARLELECRVALGRMCAVLVQFLMCFTAAIETAAITVMLRRKERSIALRADQLFANYLPLVVYPVLIIGAFLDAAVMKARGSPCLLLAVLLLILLATAACALLAHQNRALQQRRRRAVASLASLSRGRFEVCYSDIELSEEPGTVDGSTARDLAWPGGNDGGDGPPSLDEQNEQTSQLLKDAFELFDVDDSGTISYSEARLLLAAMCAVDLSRRPSSNFSNPIVDQRAACVARRAPKVPIDAPPGQERRAQADWRPVRGLWRL